VNAADHQNFLTCADQLPLTQRGLGLLDQALESLGSRRDEEGADGPDQVQRVIDGGIGRERRHWRFRSSGRHGLCGVTPGGEDHDAARVDDSRDAVRGGAEGLRRVLVGGGVGGKVDAAFHFARDARHHLDRTHWERALLDGRLHGDLDDTGHLLRLGNQFAVMAALREEMLGVGFLEIAAADFVTRNLRAMARRARGCGGNRRGR
jgi:hypothetical protein